MRFGICNEVFEGWEIDKVFDAAKKMGYQGVELAPFTLSDTPTRLPQDRRKAIRDAAECRHLEVIGLHWLLAKTEGYHLTSADKVVRKATADYLIDLTRLCADIGGRVMVLGSPKQRSLLPGVSYEEAFGYAVEVLKNVSGAAEKLDITLCIEPLAGQETDFINTADQAWALAQAIGSPNVRIILDVKAMSSEQRPIIETIKAHISHAAHFHANDPNLKGPGFGSEDFQPIMNALVDADYQGYVSVEVFDFQPDPITIAYESLHYMTRCLVERSPRNA